MTLIMVGFTLSRLAALQRNERVVTTLSSVQGDTNDCAVGEEVLPIDVVSGRACLN